MDERARVTGLMMAAWTTQAIYVGAELRLFDALASGPRASDELAQATGSHPPSLYRLMRALASLGLLTDLGDGRFELAEGGQLLRSDAPGSVRGMALHWGKRLWGALSELKNSVQTGEPWRISGLEGFQHMASDPEQVAMFHQSMTDSTAPVAKAVLEAYDFSRFNRIMDVGGSMGAMLAAVLKAHPKITGESFDLATLSDGATAYLKAQGVADRARFRGGSFFDEVPSGFDAYMLKAIIHDWDDENSVRILTNVCKAAGSKGVVLVMDRVVPDRMRPGGVDAAHGRADMMMMTATGGMERTEAQFRSVFDRAGLRLERIVPTASEFNVLEGVAKA